MITPNHTANGDLRVDRLGASSMKDVIYKTVGGKALYASIVVPHDLRSGSYPVVIRWHGGGLVNGHRLYAPWFARYLLDYIQKAKAIIVLPDYRLLPGASGMDILEDVRDFFTWLDQGNLGPHLDDGVFANLDDMMVSGESAGGWLAIQSALTQCPGRFRALIAQYPMVDMRDSHWTMPDSKKYLGGSIATDLKDLDKFWKPEEKIVTSRMPPDGGEIYHCLVRQGLYGKVFGHDKELYPLELLDENASLPPLWLMHGLEDSIVPASGTIKLANKILQVAATPVHLTLHPGGEHLFDVDRDAGEEWVRHGLGFLKKYWPAQRA